MNDSDALRDRVEAAAALLEAVLDDRGLLVELDPELRKRLLMAAGRVARPDTKARRTFNRAARKKDLHARRDHDEALLDKTGIRTLRENPIFKTPRRQALHNGERPPTIGAVHEPRTCYVCRASFSEVHHFYDQMCRDCGDFNFAKRHQVADLRGRVALVTGARVKIGFQAAIILLRSGATVHCTTRFPKDAAARYAAEADFEQWRDRLVIHGLDLRHTPSVEAFCKRLLATLDRLDVIINNACQTVRRPTGFYDHLMVKERTPVAELPDAEREVLAPIDGAPSAAGAAASTPSADASAAEPSTTRASGSGLATSGAHPDLAQSAALSQVALLPEDLGRDLHLFPQGELDADLQQVDLREVNSWRLKAEDVPAVELLEVHLVNAVAPFVLNARLRPLLAAVPSNDAHVVNVSAMEGQFYRTFKSDRHPHTNMAKAALNMLTRTSAMDYIEDGIHMNSVDTGWVTDEDPVLLAARKKEMHRFNPPLDIVDGAARIVDPFVHGINTGEQVWGQFLKDYRETDW